MSRISFILFLRLKQMKRAIVHAGPGVVLLAFVVTFGLLMQALAALREMGWVAVGLMALAVIGSVHASRKDLVFLRSVCNSGRSFKGILAAEYMLLLLPLVLVFGWGGKWQQLLAVMAGPFLIALLADLFPKAKKQQTKKGAGFIPKNIFEIRSSVEKKPFFFAAIYLIAFLSFFHISWFVISIVTFSVFMAEIFKYFEPTTMVHWEEGFVSKKIKMNIGFLLLAYLPPFLLCLFFQWELKWLAVYAMAVLITVAVLAINFKYANYSPLYPEMGSSNTLSFLLLLSFLPGFVLIALGYAAVQYFKAEKNMAYYFGDVARISQPRV